MQVDFYKTNDDYFQENLKKGNLHSQLKDGIPKSNLEKIMVGYRV